LILLKEKNVRSLALQASSSFGGGGNGGGHEAQSISLSGSGGWCRTLLLMVAIVVLGVMAGSSLLGCRCCCWVIPDA
jgi:hypothetical protein